MRSLRHLAALEVSRECCLMLFKSARRRNLFSETMQDVRAERFGWEYTLFGWNMHGCLPRKGYCCLNSSASLVKGN